MLTLRRRAVTLGIGVFLALWSQCAASTAGTPNILMIAVDDLNDWVGPLGGHPQVQTPWLDRLAARGVTFTNAHCQAPLCNPSRTSLLTGKRPSTTGIYGLAPWFREVQSLADLETLPQFFQRRGYKTLIGGKIFHAGYARGDASEGDVWGPVGGIGISPSGKLIPPTPMGNHPAMDWGLFPHRDEQKGDWGVASWAVELLEGPLKSSSEPFFLSVGFFLPHVPCYASARWFDLYPPEKTILPTILDSDREDIPHSAWFLHWNLPEPRTKWMREQDQLENFVRSYLACTSFVDSQIGRVLSALEASGKQEETIVVLWSDHGYHLGEKGITGKNSLWERSTRVPLIFAGPGIAKGGKCVWPAELVDIYPTLVDCIQGQRVEGLEGASLRPQLVDPATSHPRMAITTHNPDNHSVRSRQYRLIEYADGEREFYDLQDDPHEHRNRIDDPALSDQIAAHRAWLPRSSQPPAPGSAHRILVRQGADYYWEGAKIDPARVPE